MKIKIVRAFGQTKQLRQFEPINSFCSAEVEFDATENLSKEKVSNELDAFVRGEVAKTIISYFPQGKGPAEKKDIVSEDFLGDSPEE